MSEFLPLREGDIYFWHWKPHVDRYMPYHCKSQKAIVDKYGQLVDTFWSSATDGSVLRLEDIETVFQGNEGELRQIKSYEVDYYEPEDVVSMQHSNNSGAPIYVKPGAERSKSRILEYLNYKRERAESEIRMAQDRIERIDAALADVNAGKLEGYLP